MKHLLLQYAESPNQENIDLSAIEYNPTLNLNVFKGTNIPAVNFSEQATETFTKTTGEGVDSDRNLKLKTLMDTSTQTRVQNEASDSDANGRCEKLLDTSTQTFIKTEASDSDKNFSDMEYLSATQTLTETGETLDSDK